MRGLIIADKHEINIIPFKMIEFKKINQFEFFVYSNNLVVVHSGIGIANAAAATQELISSFKVNEIYNYGAVGGTKRTKVFDLIAPARIYYHDVVTPWYKRGQTPGEAEYFNNDYKLDKSFNLASGSSFLADAKEIELVSKEMNVEIFDMETAAIAQIAAKNHVSLNVIKCVSDIIGVDSDDLGNINERITQAGKKAFDYMMEVLK